jgi:hypothetical protein
MQPWGIAPGIHIAIEVSAESASQSTVSGNEARFQRWAFGLVMNPAALPQADGEYAAPLALNKIGA